MSALQHCSCALSRRDVTVRRQAAACSWARARKHTQTRVRTYLVETCQNSFFVIRKIGVSITIEKAFCRPHRNNTIYFANEKKYIRVLLEKSELTNDGIRSDSGSVGRFELLSKK